MLLNLAPSRVASELPPLQMVLMEPEIISRECIKPSSPTPPHLKIHKLSLLDQYAPTMYTPMLLYYPANQDVNLSSTDDVISKRLQLLKQSLSETLTRFYPFAGKMKDHLSIECNDEGVYFIEARVKSPLIDFLSQPDLSFINKLLPRDFSWSVLATPGSHTAMIKVTGFACGGIVVSLFVSHAIADGKALSSFLKGWAEMACKSTDEAAVCPIFDGSSLFPQNDAYPSEATMVGSVMPFLRTGRCVMRRFVFDASAIATLKANATSSRVKNPTRVEVITALLWKRIMAASKAKSGSHRPTYVGQAVNLRPRAMPPLSEYYMGNFVWRATAFCGNGQEAAELDGLVCKLREAKAKLNEDFVRSLEGDKGFLNLCEAVKDVDFSYSGTEDFVGFSSWCNFGLYDIDFGWGKPSWVSSGAAESELMFMSVIILMDTKSRDGIEAWVRLDEEEMAFLKLDKELLAFASLDPSPLGQLMTPFSEV